MNEAEKFTFFNHEEIRRFVELACYNSLDLYVTCSVDVLVLKELLINCPTGCQFRIKKCSERFQLLIIAETSFDNSFFGNDIFSSIYPQSNLKTIFTSDFNISEVIAALGCDIVLVITAEINGQVVMIVCPDYAILPNLKVASN